MLLQYLPTCAVKLLVYLIAIWYGFLFLIRLAIFAVRRPGKFWEVKDRKKPPDCLNDPVYGTHKYISANGIKLHYVEKGDPSKPLIVFVHGYPEFWYSWRFQLKEFSKHYWTVAFDMRGYGDSDKPEGIHNYQMKYLVDDIAKFVEALGRKKFTLVAHDWGGVIGWSFVQTYPEMLNSYIIMNAPLPKVWIQLVMSDFTQFKKSWYVFFYQLPYLPELMLRLYDLNAFSRLFKKKSSKPTTITEEDIEAFKYTFGKPGAATPPINYYRANGFKLGGNKPKHKLSELEVPGLFIFGEKDDFLELKYVEMAKNLVKNIKTGIVKDANHFVQQDEPEAVNDLLSDFLKNNTSV